MRLIDADALIQFFQSSKNQKAFYTYFTTTDIIRVLDNAPTLTLDDLREKGEWIECKDLNGDTYYDCSVCGESFCLIDGSPTDNLFKFCPNCGAKMGGGE
mgnify:CR=1 FL=1